MSKLSLVVPLTRSALLAGVLIAACEPGPAEYADLVLTGGKVVTVDDALPEAEALAVTGYTITAVGTKEEIAGHVGPSTEVVELDGRLVIPGFIEGHGHYMALGESKLTLDLNSAASWEDIVQMVADAATQAAPGEWILGRGWHQEKWTATPEGSVEGVPVHASLSAVSPENPVDLEHSSGHAAFANALAMELAGIDDDTPDPPGGTIVRDASGAATGLMRETAQRLVGAARARSEAERSAEDLDAEFRREVELAGAESLMYGVTTFHDAGSSFETIDRLRALAEEGALPIRLYVMVRGASNEEMDEKLADYRTIPEGNDFLAVRSIKRQIDGALGSHGAWLLGSYADMDTEGLVLETVEDITGTAEVAIRHGFQVNTHAIGDRANREVLDIYEKIFAANPDATDLRWRIEHAQHLHPDDVGRFAELDVVAAMQGVHATSDGPWLADRLGQLRMMETSYVWRDVLDAGVVIANGTDVPVEHISPIASFYSSVSRRMNNGEVLSGQHRMTREEALESYTINNAYAAFEEHLKGSLTPGKLADIVVLSQDIMTIPEDDIPATEVVYTIVGGEVRYSGPEG
ncbi:MAG: amidohydrolase [Gammaproteobacteria bacterium]|nr:amidohydrolase [Gammaproteobacteria bacterium]MDE0651828.1 amidohydrolase [Gammaproteobacteria bacterium]